MSNVIIIKILLFDVRDVFIVRFYIKHRLINFILINVLYYYTWN